MNNSNTTIINDGEIKYCPYRVYTETQPPIMQGCGDITVQKFYQCIKSECMAYSDGKCLKNDKDYHLSKGYMRVVNISNGDDNIKRLTETLHNIGMKSKSMGFGYIIDSVLLVVSANDRLSITKDIYPTVAIQHGTTPSRIERGIRATIISAWDNGDYELQNKLFGSSIGIKTGIPTNGNFIYTIADALIHNLI